MESPTPSRLSRSAPTMLASSPIKPSPLTAAPSPAKAAPFAQIPTPTKQIELPRRARNRSVALSLKEVKRVALGLQGPSKETTDRSDLIRSDDDLLFLEQNLAAGLVSKPSRVKTRVKLLDKYETLVEFFNSMESSIRLHRLKGSMSTFPNICTSIQHLTERKFTYGHLGQLKYILPEAIVIKKLLLRDEATCCMKPELLVALQVDAIEDSMKKGESGYSAMRRIFRERLVDFVNKHPKGDDVPEEMLPYPFDQSKPILPQKIETVSTQFASVDPLPNALSHQQFALPSHVPGSFRRRFSQRAITHEEKTPLACLSEETPKEDCPISTPCISKKSPVGLPILSSSAIILRSPEEKTKKIMSVLERTPSKEALSTPARLMTRTPDFHLPKRSRSALGDESPPPLKKSKKRSTRTKLFTTPKKNDIREDERKELASSSFDTDDDAISFLPKLLLQSIKEKERKTLEDKEAGVDESIKRQKMISQLPNMFDMILLIFQSAQRSTLTKQELIHKIIASHAKIVDKGEVEEQLKLLQELVPDCVLEKRPSSGDALCCVNKVSSPQEVRQRLAESV